MEPLARVGNVVVRGKDFQHPLAGFVLAQFTDQRPAHDATTILDAMGAPSKPSGAQKAYKVVAGDILDLLLLQGILVKDAYGWFRVKGGHK